MCLILYIITFFVFTFSLFVNIYINIAYKEKLADCFLKDQGFIRSIFIGQFGIFIRELIFSFLLIFSIIDYFSALNKYMFIFSFLSAALTAYLFKFFFNILRKKVNEIIGIVHFLGFIPFLVSIFFAILYVFIVLKFAYVKDIIPSLDFERYFSYLLENYSKCGILGYLVIFSKAMDYIVANISILTLKFSKIIFICFISFLAFKEGLKLWIINRLIFNLMAIREIIKKV